MIFRSDIYCPSVRRKVRIWVSIPKYYEEGLQFDALYMLDGQNIFKDNESSFGRSLRFGKYLAIMASKMGKRICGIAISNAGSDLGRVNEYSPFLITRRASDEWNKQDVNVCKAFTKDLFETIIPFVEKHYPVIQDKNHRFIFGSSLGAMYAAYLANNFDCFGAAGLFSNCPFLAEEEFYGNYDKVLNKNVRYFNYVGLKETSDNDFDETLYYESAIKLHNFFKDNGISSRLVVDINGIHNEATWEKHVLEFLTYIYEDDVFFTV